MRANSMEKALFLHDISRFGIKYVEEGDLVKLSVDPQCTNTAVLLDYIRTYGNDEIAKQIQSVIYDMQTPREMVVTVQFGTIKKAIA